MIIIVLRLKFFIHILDENDMPEKIFSNIDNAGQELGLMLNFIKKTDPYQYSVIARKMVNFLFTKGIEDGRELFVKLGSAGNEESILTEINMPSQKQMLDNSYNLGESIFEIAERHIKATELFLLIQKWLEEEKLSNLLKVLANQNTRIADISSAIHRYHFSASGFDLTKSATGRGILVSLIRRFLNDQLEYLNIAKNYFEFNDFYKLLGKTIYHPESHGKLGGKSAGAILAMKVIEKNIENKKLFNNVKFPKTWFIASDGTVNFLYYNSLEDVIEQKYKDMEDVRKEYHHIVQVFKNSQFSPDIVNGLSRALDDFGDNPIIVRSSSLLEDRLGSAFAGKYKSLFLANQGTKQQKLEALLDAVAEVYASTFSPDPIGYRIERGLLDFNEEMGIMIQEVVGKRVGKFFFPAFAGVAFSYNEFRWSPRIKREDGLLRIVPGLGTRAVDRLGNDFPMLISPTNPELKVNSTFHESLMYSPKYMDVLNLESNRFETHSVEAILKYCGSNFPMLNEIFSIIRENHLEKPVGLGIDSKNDEVLVTFDNLISRTDYIRKLHKMIIILKENYDTPVDLEFACDGDNLYILQCRPQSASDDFATSAQIPTDIREDKKVFSASKFVSNGKVPDINYIVYIDPIKYSSIKTLDEMKLVGRAVGKLNDVLPKQNFILMGPGRWGSRGDIKLGVSVTYSDIKNTAVLIEIAKTKGEYKPDLSFGTHFFQDLVESGIKYLPLYPEEVSNVFNENYLDNSENIFSRLVPEYNQLENVVKVINVPESSNGDILRILMNADLEQAIAFLTPPFTPETYYSEPGGPKVLTNEEPWHIRLRVAEMIARQFDLKRFSAEALYVIGTVCSKTSTPSSDLDLLVIFSGDDNLKSELLAWFEGWGLSLSEQMFKRTGYRIHNFIDVTLISPEELNANDYYKKMLNQNSSESIKLK